MKVDSDVPHRIVFLYRCSLNDAMTSTCIIGAGYVGLTYAAGLASKNLKVNLVDVNTATIACINKGTCPIDEPGLEKALKDGVKRGLIHGHAILDLVFAESDVFFVCVGTYCDDAGNINLAQVRSVAQAIRDCFKMHPDAGYKVICVKSTVICGTTDSVLLPVIEESGMKAGKDFGVAMSPEFLKEGSALDDILNPDKIVVGGIDQRSIDAVKNVLKAFLKDSDQHKLIETDVRTAELIKYAQNSFLATKISFINEMARFAELFGVNISMVAKAMGMDSRISPKFLNAGPGFGGSCFPKDVKALYSAGKKAGLDPLLLKAVLDVNERQKRHVLELLQQHRQVKGLAVAVLGLAFKANTGDTRESVCRAVIPGLLALGASRVKVHDPSAFAREEVKKDFPPDERLTYHDTIAEAIKGSGACIILTEWDEYKRLKFSEFTTMAGNPCIVDSRRILDRKAFEKSKVQLVILGESESRDFKP
nr:UDP-glucose/GDP-mannose dehydrogenase family protein [Candidatus Sigynarchaeota archaeon]